MAYKKKVNNFTVFNYAAILILVLSPFVITAQTNPSNKSTPAQQKAMAEMQWMQRVLVLTPEQYDQVSVINERYAHKCDSLDRIKDTNARDAAKTKCNKSKDDDLKLALNAQQYKQYLDHKGKKYKPARSPFGGSY